MQVESSSRSGPPKADDGGSLRPAGRLLLGPSAGGRGERRSPPPPEVELRESAVRPEITPPRPGLRLRARETARGEAEGARPRPRRGVVSTGRSRAVDRSTECPPPPGVPPSDRG